MSNHSENPTGPETKRSESKRSALKHGLPGSENTVDLHSTEIKIPNIVGKFKPTVEELLKWDQLKDMQGLTDAQLATKIIRRYLASLR